MPAEIRIGMKREHNHDEVRMVLYQREDYRACPLFTAALDRILAEKTAGGAA